MESEEKGTNGSNEEDVYEIGCKVREPSSGIHCMRRTEAGLLGLCGGTLCESVVLQLTVRSHLGQLHGCTILRQLCAWENRMKLNVASDIYLYTLPFNHE